MVEGGKSLAPFVTLMSCNERVNLAAGKVLYNLLKKAYGHVQVRCLGDGLNRRLATTILP